MTGSQRTRLSKYLSKILRHAPGEIGLTLEPGGWVSIEELIAAAGRARMAFTREELDEIVQTSDKQRFAYDESGMKIRANQGHTTEVELQFERADPPALLYHGTPERNVEAIQRDGLQKMARHHVHLSADTATAAKVGERRGKQRSWWSMRRECTRPGLPSFVPQTESGSSIMCRPSSFPCCSVHFLLNCSAAACCCVSSRCRSVRMKSRSWPW